MTIKEKSKTQNQAFFKRGEIYFAALSPTVGSETNKTRPVLIVSNDANNRLTPVITVVPLTSKTEKVYPFEVLIPQEESGLKKNAKAQCNQIRTISKARIKQVKPSGRVEDSILFKINQALKLYLNIE